MLNRKPTKVELANKGIIHGNDNLLSPFCLVNDQSISHLFAEYRMVTRVWENIYL